ncbi:MAG: response regulator [Kofleriaceae bacterium]|nr:response regulator [Kofleriaceae bacterium]
MAERARILVVDDEPLNLDLLRRTLQRDFDVAVASSAAEAVTWLDAEAGAVAVVLCDQLMPGRSGTELAAEIRERWPGVKFVLVTGVDEAEEVVAAQKAGLLDEVVAKPWRGAQVRERLKELAAEAGAAEAAAGAGAGAG